MAAESNRELLIHPPEVRSIERGWRRSARIEKRFRGELESSFDLWFEVASDGIEPPPSQDGEAFLIAGLFIAMAEGRDIQLQAGCSRELLGNLEEFSGAWHMWAPSKYQRIRIAADGSINRVKQSEVSRMVERKAVATFTGGLDSTFTVWRHASRAAGHRALPLQCAAFVHGFDIPLSDPAGFRSAADKAQATLSPLDVPLVELASNFREVVKVNWEDCHGAALVAALQNLKTEANTALLASGAGYARSVLPWGSNPVTDPLLSSRTFTVLHDGASYTRQAKAAAVAAFEPGRDALRVCWEGSERDRNCGRCEKCVRTMFAFQALGQPVPRSFPISRVGKKQLEGIELHRQGLIHRWGEILEAARRREIDEPWVREVERKIAAARKNLSRRSPRLISMATPKALVRRWLDRMAAP